MDVIKFLDDLCNIESNKDTSAGFNQLEKNNLNIIEPSSWVEWINDHDGESKLHEIVEFANDKDNRYIVSRIQDVSNHIIKISKDSSASDFIFSHPFWKNVSETKRKQAQFFITLPYIKISLAKNDAYDSEYDEYVPNERAWEFNISNVIIPSTDDEIYQALEVLTSIYMQTGVILDDDDTDSKFNDFSTVVINAVNKMDKDKIVNTASFRYMFNRLFYIVFDPENHCLDEVKEFIHYMTKKPEYFEFIKDETTEMVYKRKYFSKFIANATKYLEIKENPDLLDWELIKMPAENEFWNKVCKRIFIQGLYKADILSHDFGFYNLDILLLNNFLKNNELFRKQMIKCAKKSPYALSMSQKIWNDATKHMNFKESNIYKDSRTGNYIAELFYLVLGPTLEKTLLEDYKGDIKKEYNTDSLNQLREFLAPFRENEISRESSKRKSYSKSRISASKSASKRI